MGRHPTWLPPEADLLESLAGDTPFPDVVRLMQRAAAQHGWPSRSARAIQLRLRRTGHPSRVRAGQHLTSGGVASILGCPADRVVGWMARPVVRRILEPRRIGVVLYVDRAGWRRLARQQPRILGGFPVERLYALLEDQELAERVAAVYPRQVGDYRIRCLETGQVWASSEAAAAELHVTGSAIRLAIRKRRPVTSLGLTFERLRDLSAVADLHSI